MLSFAAFLTMAALFWLSFFGYSLLFGCPVQAVTSWLSCPVPSWLPCPGWPSLAALFRLSSPGCALLVALSWLSWPDCPVLDVPSRHPVLAVLSCLPVLAAPSSCSLLIVLSWLFSPDWSCPGCPALVVLSGQSCLSSLVLAVLSWQFWPSSPALAVLF